MLTTSPTLQYLPPVDGRSVSGFVGLKNGGATCYMNAVFQQLYMQPGLPEVLHILGSYNMLLLCLLHKRIVSTITVKKTDHNLQHSTTEKGFFCCLSQQCLAASLSPVEWPLIWLGKRLLLHGSSWSHDSEGQAKQSLSSCQNFLWEGVMSLSPPAKNPAHGPASVL